MSQEARKIGSLTKAMAAVLDERRRGAGVSQRAFAEQSGIPQGSLSKILSGKMAIDVTQLELMARALDVPAAELLRAAEARLDDTPEPPDTATREPNTNPTPNSEIILDGYRLAAKEWKDRSAEIEGHQEMP